MLQLTTKVAINMQYEVSGLIQKVGKLVKSVRKSTLNTEESDRFGSASHNCLHDKIKQLNTHDCIFVEVV